MRGEEVLVYSRVAGTAESDAREGQRIWVSKERSQMRTYSLALKPELTRTQPQMRMSGGRKVLMWAAMSGMPGISVIIFSETAVVKPKMAMISLLHGCSVMDAQCHSRLTDVSSSVNSGVCSCGSSERDLQAGHEGKPD